MNLTINKSITPKKVEIIPPSSKSESNRALLIQALSQGKIELSNLSSARDTQTMLGLLSENPAVWDVKDAGTTMRFCTAYLALVGERIEITGTERMHQRPIHLLVDALRSLGATIKYKKTEGFPPLIISKIINQQTRYLRIPGHISSQYISALLMIAPVLPMGLELELTGKIYSRPYIEMTLALMKHFGINSEWKNQVITIDHQLYKSGKYDIETDWSGASYWYSVAALSPGSEILIRGLRSKSYQGDQIIQELLLPMGITTQFNSDGAVVKSNHERQKPGILKLDFKDCPDLAQTITVIAACLGWKINMTGLESLRIKETDRIAALQIELRKLGAKLSETEEGKWELLPGILPKEIAPIDTYDDHRMAMAFAPVACLRDITLENPDVVQKSYPSFWQDMEKIGFQLGRK